MFSAAWSLETRPCRTRFVLVVLDDIDLIDGIDGDVARGLRVVAAQGILPLDVELIDRLTLILYPSIPP